MRVISNPETILGKRLRSLSHRGKKTPWVISQKKSETCPLETAAHC
jgi:hypothetical protein